MRRNRSVASTNVTSVGIDFDSQSRSSRRRNFPYRTGGDGCPEAYNALIGIGRNLAEALSRTQADVHAGAFVHRFLTQVLSDYSNVQARFVENATVNCLPEIMFESIKASTCDPEHRLAPLFCQLDGSGTESFWIDRSMCNAPGASGPTPRKKLANYLRLAMKIRRKKRYNGMRSVTLRPLWLPRLLRAKHAKCGQGEIYICVHLLRGASWAH